MQIFSEAKVAPVGQVNAEDIKKMAWNLLIFSAPATSVFFALLATGVPFSKAWPAAVLIFWGILADFLKKLKETK